MSAPILVTVGTDHHPFDRLIDWVDGWWERHDHDGVELVVQHGTTTAPRLAPATPFLDRDDLDDLLARSRAVVCHGGPATIMEARAAGIHPIVVARDPRWGEHVDDHQLRFAGQLAADGLITPAHVRDDLFTALDRAVADPKSYRLAASGNDVSHAVERFGQIVDEVLLSRRRVPR